MFLPIRRVGILALVICWSRVSASRPGVDLEGTSAGYLGLDREPPPPSEFSNDLDKSISWPRRAVTHVQRKGCRYRWDSERGQGCCSQDEGLVISNRGASLVQSAETTAAALAALVRFLLDFVPDRCSGNRCNDEDSACKFPGVYCSPEGPTAILFNCTKLGMNGSNVAEHKALPSVIGNITTLKVLELLECPITSFPDELRRLEDLVELNVYRCPIAGRIPMFFAGFKRLQVMSLERLELSGKIPIELSDLSEVRYFSLRANKLVGRLSEAFFEKMRRVEHFNVEDNQLRGRVPDTVARATSLRYLSLSRNGFSGRLPDLAALKDLEWLSMDHNTIKGRPPQVHSMPNLTYLDFNDNLLSGSLPSGIGALDKLQVLDCANNSLTGELPKDFGSNLGQLEWLDLFNNSLSGDIPVTIGDMRELLMLDLSDNKFSGTIPERIGRLRKLVFLGLASNALEGRIPDLADLQDLLLLNLGDNLLTGTIPRTFGSLESIVGIFLDRNRLSGQIPEEVQHLNHLSFLVVHENALRNKVPQFQLHPCSLPVCRDSLVLTLYGNHLSCKLPKLVDRRYPFKGAIVFGNKFTMPSADGRDWLPEKADPVHFVKDGLIRLIVEIVLAGAGFWFLVVLLVLRRDALHFFRAEVFAQAEAHEPKALAHLQLLGLLLALSVLALAFLLPACSLGSTYTECGDELAHYGITYIERSQLYEKVVLAVLLTHLILVIRFTEGIPQSSQQSGNSTVGVVCYCLGYLAVLVVMALVPVGYAAVKTLPWDNRIQTSIGPWAYMCVYYGAPAANAIVQSLILPGVAAFFARQMQCSVRGLLTSAYVICVWAAPICAVVYMGEGCGKRWRNFWNACQDDRFEAKFTLLTKDNYAMTPASVCRIPDLERMRKQHNGGCTRDIIEVVTPLLLSTSAIEAFVFPTVFLLVWTHSQLSEDGTELQLRGLRVSYSTEDVFVQLDIWAMSAILWGPLVPLLQPLLFMAVCISYVMLCLETRYFGCTSSPPARAEGPEAAKDLFLSKTMLRSAACYLLAILCCFFLEMYLFEY